MHLGEEDGVRQGKNVIAVHALNFRHVDRDFLFRMSLDWWGELEGVEPTPGFLSQVSPDAPNVGSFEEVLTPPTFEQEASIFNETKTVSLVHENPRARIYFTIDGSLPDESSTLYQGVISLRASAQINARAYAEDFAPSPITTRVFIATSSRSNTLSFDSDLPVVVIDTQDSRISSLSRTPALMHIYDVLEDGRARLNHTPVFQGGGLT